MSFDFEELGYEKTPLGEISLRRRSEPRLGGKILYEVKLGDEFLMSSLFTESEIQLAKLGIAALEGDNFDVVVGGLGLGYTAVAALESEAVKSLRVIDVMQPVIDWHQQGLVPLGKTLVDDPRCSLLQADFFELALSADHSFNPEDPHQLFHAILLDIDHSPDYWLNPGNSTFYTPEGFQSLANKIHPGGIFALWSNDPPNDEFMQLLGSVFHSTESHVVYFPNPYLGKESSCTVYLARTKQ